MEILHKAKRKDNGEWVEGYYCKYQPCASKEEYVHGIIPLYASALYMIEIGPETVCVYTGIKDKDGNRIWENDILDISEEMHSETYQGGKCVSESNWVNKYRHKVEFTPGSLMNTQRYLAGGNITCKKIGNAVDNPELLERTV